MMNRKKTVAGNWKMNLNYAEAMALADAVAGAVSATSETHIILAPPFVYLHDIVVQVQNHAAIAVAAQNCSEKSHGAFTGEVSSSMLSSIGVDYVIIGHSERRKYFNENDAVLAGKVKRALEHALLPVFCCGEILEQRNSGKHFDLVQQQIETGLFHLDRHQFSECVIAYEPVWAIGTGVNATPDQAQEMHAFIRELIRKKFGSETAGTCSVLYGGSVTAKNAEDLFSCPDVDGGLVGGASLKPDEFISIIRTMERLHS